jgi:hypothetical protein
MQARFSDPQGPRWIHAVLQLPAVLLVLAAATGGFAAGYAGMLIGLAVIASSGAALLQLRQAPAEGSLDLGPGRVKIAAGRLRAAIHAREITGASTAKTERGYALTLARKGRATPTTLEVETEAEVDRLRIALGVGHGGHGALAWWTAPSQSQRSAFGGRITSLVVTTALLAAVAYRESDGDGSFGFLALASFIGFMAIPIGLILSALGASKLPAPSVEMTAEGIRLTTTRGPFLLPYVYYAGFERQGDHLVFPVPAPWGQVSVLASAPTRGAGVTDDDLAILRAQLDGAALRARGFGRTKEEVAGRVETLRRGRESARDWLSRLDMVGQTLMSGAGYRGQSLDAEDLWMVLEDPDAEEDLRTAAARILRHVASPDAKVRIAAAVAAIRDEDLNERVRVVAEEPLEEAVVVVDEIEKRRWGKMAG